MRLPHPHRRRHVCHHPRHHHPGCQQMRGPGHPLRKRRFFGLCSHGSGQTQRKLQEKRALFVFRTAAEVAWPGRRWDRHGRLEPWHCGTARAAGMTRGLTGTAGAGRDCARLALTDCHAREAKRLPKQPASQPTSQLLVSWLVGGCWRQSVLSAVLALTFSHVSQKRTAPW